MRRPTQLPSLTLFPISNRPRLHGQVHPLTPFASLHARALFTAQSALGLFSSDLVTHLYLLCKIAHGLGFDLNLVLLAAQDLLTFVTRARFRKFWLANFLSLGQVRRYILTEKLSIR